ncbi:type II and III secretion system family protein [Mariprofundus sp. EBB-1]|uniref:type II and III secretion system family protein n=1 Tax=Mariprofundus sp. EBB-1 TaxID=2650971 RepID=UPI000EF23775|nr:type II and III secretion system family protein [Mariprofundus sp. EBB-1]RLL54980.1 type II and III secretion system family protein [Mariprofundus sp. EBB-1]
MKRLLAAVMLLCFSFTLPAFAATDVVNVYFLSLQEAADAARSQLSDTGKVATVPSQRLLILDDDTTHINKAKALLKRIDHAPGQYTAHVSIEDIRTNARSSLQTSGAASFGQLSGGWMRVQWQQQKQHSNHRQTFQLRVSSMQQGSIETGTIQSFTRETRLWLSGYGVVQANSVELVPVTSGFHITTSAVGTDQVRVRIVPWMQRLQTNVQGQQEMLMDLGSSNAPSIPAGNRANMRFNAQPRMATQPVIELLGAATEIVIPVDQPVTIAATNSEAQKLGSALLSSSSRVGKRQFVIQLRVSRN